MSRPDGRDDASARVVARPDICRQRMGRRPAHQQPHDLLEMPLMTNEHHDTVVIEDGRGGNGMGAVVGIIAILVLLAAVWYFALGPGAGSTSTTNNNTINNGGTAPAATQPAAPASS
jgi:hypothetical protein